MALLDNPTTSKRSILVVDDEEGIRAVLEKRLYQSGYLVDVAANGRHALQKIESGRLYNLILCDLKMPLLTGVEFLKEIRKKGNTVPVILITGHPDRELLQTAASYNLTGIILKPYNHVQLLKKIESVLQGESQIVIPA